MKSKRNIVVPSNEIQSFTDHFPSMLGYWDKHLRNRHANQAYADYFGKTPEQIRGKTIRHLLGSRLFKMNRPYMIAALSGKAQTFERKIQTPSGKIMCTLANYIPHFEGNEVEGFFVIVTDVTPVLNLHEKNLQLQATLASKSRLFALGEMAASIAHEINNPLAIIYGHACHLTSLVEHRKFDPKIYRDSLSVIQETSLRIEKIVDGLRSIARDGESDEIEEASVSDIVNQTVAICESRFREKKVSIKVSRISDRLRVKARQVQVSQILLNLLNNALDALEKRRAPGIKITVTAKSDSISILVSNNGPKILPHIAKRIFDPFYTTKSPHHGAGLGLSISRNLAKTNGGTLALAKSQPVTFKLTLPRSKKNR